MITSKETLSVRRTHQYNSGWSHLDEWQDIGTARHLGDQRRTTDHDSVRVSRIWSVSSTASAEDIRRALLDLETHGCTCDHDCCGHMQWLGINARRVGKTNIWVTRASGYRNV